jgi:hypothetical protein
MPKVSNTPFFIKSFEHLLTGKLTAREVLIYGIVHQFEINRTPCFISRQELAKRINESEATAERSLQLLIKEGLIRITRQGRKRYLHTVNLYQLDTHQHIDLYQKEGQSVSKQGVDLYQLDTLTRSITRSIKKTNLIKSNYNNININNNIRENMKGETEAEKTRRLHLKALWDDPTGWDDIGHALTKWDEITNTLLRKVKPVHQDPSWNGRIDYGDIPE